MKTIFRLFFVTTAIAVTTPAMAYNDWYHQGYADGAVSTEMACNNKNQNAVHSLSLENQQLKERIAILEASTFNAEVTQDVPQTAVMSGNPLRRANSNNNFYAQQDVD